jgi:hypothetical protein
MARSSRKTRSSPKPRSPRKRSTAERLTGLLGTRSGRDIPALSAKLNWQPHSVRAALSRLRKDGVAIEKLPPAAKGGGARYRLADETREGSQ